MSEKPFHNRYFAYLNSAVLIIKEYDGTMPLAAFLKIFFAKNKKYGSKDRKQIAHLCYCYFRLGKLDGFKNIEQRILKGLLVATPMIDDAWKIVAEEFEADKVLIEPDQIFPFHEMVSETIDAAAFSAALTVQPKLFLRIRPGNEKDVLQKLQINNIVYDKIEDAIIIDNNIKINTVLAFNKEVVVQDLSSQKISKLLLLLKNALNIQNSKINIWDCCAASGGKSILAKDVFSNGYIVATDIRSSIIHNLNKRFFEAGITNYQAYVLDAIKDVPKQKFDLVIADVPCTGSGTWSRTPEGLFYFDKKEIEGFVNLQKQILENIIKSIKPNGYLLYSTCSVFKQENEMQIQYLKEKFSFKIIQTQIIKGYTQKADTMFAALLQL